MQNEVVLKLRPRPLRLVYLVNGEADLINAVRLYTHLWGGLSNTIFPAPHTVDQLNEIDHALRLINPDYILLPQEDLSDECLGALEQLPIRYLRISSSRIEEIVSTNDLTGLPIETLNSFQTKNFPHIIKVLNYLYRSPISSSSIYLFSENPLLDSEIFPTVW